MNRSQFLAVPALLVAGLIGFAIGRMVGPPAKMENVTRVASVPSTPVTADVRLDESLENARTVREDAPAEASRERARMPAIERLREASQDAVGASGWLKVFSITSQLSAEEIPAALALARTAEREMQETIKMAALTRWAELDPRAAAEGARALKEPGGNAVKLVLTEWAQRDAGAARAWIDGLPQDEQPKAASGYLTGLAMRDPAAAFRELAALPSAGSRETYDAIFNAWAKRDPRTAATHAPALPDHVRENALRAIVGWWSRSEPAAALAWAQTLPQEKDRILSVGDLMRSLGIRNPQFAMQQTLALPEELRDSAARQLIEPLMQSVGVEQARRFAESLPAGRGRDDAVATVAGRWARTDPQAAAQFFLAQPTNSAQDKAFGAIALNWALHDSVAAGRWVAQLPEGSNRAAAANQLIELWARRDLQAAAKWIEQLPAGASRDAAASTYAGKVCSTDPAAAMDWAATVSDTAKRESVVRGVIGSWRQRDRAASQRWLETTSVISEDLRSALLRAQ